MSYVRPGASNGPLESSGLPESAVKELRGFVESAGAEPRGALFLSGGQAKAAAGAMAHELGRGLFRVDLSRVVSKYIGETEKNIDLAFAAAEGQGAILLLDEADALFGRRSEVKDGHDRYVEIEINYLLQKMESYDGLVIVATNAPVKIDTCRFCRYVDIDEVKK
jgi:SpoVK/Ycf46/Vps4 family AAA+-type ATPase